MDQHTLPDGYLTAGLDYFRSVVALGLEPDGLLWAFDASTCDFALILVTPHVDDAGPIALSKLLFKAYNAAATPKEISPFVVRIHSPAQPIVAQLREVYGSNIKIESFAVDAAQPVAALEAGDLTFKREWVYHLAPLALTSLERGRKWRSFERNVDALAA